MRKLTCLSCAAMALALGACGPTETKTEVAETPAAPATPPPPAKAWISDMGGKDGRARLVYALPGAAEYDLKFECKAKGPVYVTPGAKPPEGAKEYAFVLGTSGGDMPINSGVYNGVAEAAVPANSFGNIRYTGTLTLKESGKEPVNLDAKTPEQKAMIDQFFKGCVG